MASDVYFAIVSRSCGYRALCKSEGNNKLIWWTEVYNDKRDARRAITLMQAFTPSAQVYDLTN
jgi:uncharacterized protein YegP (UPF0339 family)